MSGSYGCSRTPTLVFTALISAASTLAVTTTGTQDAPRADGVIAGVVVDATTGEPVAGARVRLGTLDADIVAAATQRLARRLDRTLPPVTQPTRTTDPNGRFEFTQLAAGSYWGAVDAAGFTGSELGELKTRFDSNVGAPRVILGPGERVDNLVTRLWRAGSVRGRVTDEHGDPIVKASVHAFRRVYGGGRPSWSRARLAQTDDRGRFQLDNLWSGTYLVALEANPAAGRQRTVFHGGSLTARAGTSVQLAAGQHLEGVDLVYAVAREAALVPLSLSGRVTGGVGKAGAPTVVHLVPNDAEDSLGTFEELTASSSADGSFTFPNVPAGDYRVQVWQFPPLERVPTLLPGPGPADTISVPDSTTLRFGRSPTWVADLPVSLDRSIEGLVIALRPAARISGRVVFEGGQPPRERLRWLPVIINSTQGREYREIDMMSRATGGLAEVEADGTFASVGLPAGKYSLLIEPSIGAADPQLVQWTTASVFVGGREMAGSAIELGTSDVTGVVVTMAPRAQLSGSVRDASRRPVPHASVMIFPRDPQRWSDYQDFFLARRIRRVIADRQGLFEVPIFPGEYLVAVTPDPPEFWMDPQYLESLVPSAVSVVVPRGGTGSVDVTSRTAR